MSASKRWFEDENPDMVAAETGNDAVCIPEDEGRLFFSGDDPELNDALDDYLTRTAPHPHDGDE